MDRCQLDEEQHYLSESSEERLRQLLEVSLRLIDKGLSQKLLNSGFHQYKATTDLNQDDEVNNNRTDKELNAIENSIYEEPISATNREPIYTGKQQVSTRLQLGLNPLDCGSGVDLQYLEGWSAAGKASRGKVLFWGMELMARTSHENGGDEEGTAAAVQQQRTEMCSVSWLAGSEASHHPLII
ncbi:hypothetical protein PPACK8108_LOCUS21385 [Phakopsora pachyrhizi]|uniref:Uncharacterized protein n=1 Tax=Phakopsora pachyrhizi TaxID=170000 RepID=A0AAV0BL60_PHAPC|nr:hypothetical protein PPACK8108_LOCUS21385 [Phakopsora pachyrhizi]